VNFDLAFLKESCLQERTSSNNQLSFSLKGSPVAGTTLFIGFFDLRLIVQDGWTLRVGQLHYKPSKYSW
jgi:hypothetical protein